MRIQTQWLPHTITIEPYSGNSAYGPVYGGAVADVPARVEPGIIASMGANAHAIDATARIFLLPETVITVGSRVTWVDSWGTSHTYTATEVSPQMGLREVSHIEVLAKD